MEISNKGNMNKWINMNKFCMFSQWWTNKIKRLWYITFFRLKEKLKNYEKWKIMKNYEELCLSHLVVKLEVFSLIF